MGNQSAGRLFEVLLMEDNPGDVRRAGILASTGLRG